MSSDLPIPHGTRQLRDVIRNSICLGDRVATTLPYKSSSKLFLGTVVKKYKSWLLVQIDNRPDFPEPIKRDPDQVIVFARGADTSPAWLQGKKPPRRPLVNNV